MAHRIFTGTFEALESGLLDSIVERQSADPLAPVAILVGSNVLASYLRIRIAERRSTTANVRFLTFPDLVERLIPRAGAGRAKPRLPHPGASLLLADILESETLETFARVAEFSGFRQALLGTFRDLRDADISPEALESFLSELKSLPPDRMSHLASLSWIYRQFRTRVALFQDPADDLRHASASAAGDILGTRSLFIYGLYDVTGVQVQLLRELKEALDLTYFIPFVNGTASRFAVPFLDARTRELGVEPQALPQKKAANSLGTLAGRVGADFGSATAKDQALPLTPDGTFALVSVPGESRAAVEVIREVLRAVRDGVISGFYEAAVILRNPDEEAPVLIQAFRLRGIPYFLHGGSAFMGRPLARAVLAVTGLDAESFSRRAILNAMELVAAALPSQSAQDWDVSAWRSLVNDARFLGGIGAWDAGIAALARRMQFELYFAETRKIEIEEEEEEQAHQHVSVSLAGRRLEAACSLQSAWSMLRQAAAGWPAACSWQDWTRLLRTRLEPLLNRSADWPAFVAVLDDVAALGELPFEDMPERKVSRARIVSALSEALEGVSYPEGLFQRRGVNLLSAAAARGLRFPLVIVPGLEEGRFPARLRQDPLLFDTERLQMGRPPRLPLKSLRGEEEVLLFDMAVRAAESRLVLMTSRLDEASDRERIPSQFFLRAAGAARGAAIQLNELTPEMVPGLRTVSLDNPGPGKGQGAVDKGEIRLGLIAEDPSHSHAALAEIVEAEPQLMSGPLAYERARRNRRLTAFDGRIEDLALWLRAQSQVLSGSSQFSASRIEDYAKCPYLFYLRRVQGLEKWEEEEQVEALDPLVRGQIVHAILEEFLREFAGERFTNTPQPPLSAALAALARRRLAEGRPVGMPDLLWEIEQDRLLVLLQNWLVFEKARQSDGMQPRYLERAFGTFGEETDFPPCRIEGRDAAVEFRGRIDRIDVSADGRCARITDYKTGMLPRSMSDDRGTLLMAGERIQLAVYRGALSGMEDLATVESIEGEYLHLQPRDGKTVPRAYSAGELNAALARLPEMMEIVREGIEGGIFFARPQGSVRPDGHCDYCDFLRICGKDRNRRWDTKEGDPAVESFRRLEKIDGDGEDQE